MNYSQLVDTLALLPNPEDYFQGMGEISFSPPHNILMFYRNTLSFIELHANSEFFYRHHRHIILLNTGIPIQLQLDSETIALDSQSFIFLFPYQYHRFIIDRQDGLSLIFISFEMDDDLFLEDFRYIPRYFDDNSIMLVKQSLDAFLNGDGRKLPYILGSLILDLASKKKTTIDSVRGKLKSNRLVSEICREIYKNKSCTIKELSHSMGYSESHLRKSFRKSMGISLGQYIIEVRLSAAMYNLSNSEQLVSNIAELAGYESVYSFSRAFKNYLGISPLDYRKGRKPPKGHFLEKRPHPR